MFIFSMHILSLSVCYDDSLFVHKVECSSSSAKSLKGAQTSLQKHRSNVLPAHFSWCEHLPAVVDIHWPQPPLLCTSPRARIPATKTWETCSPVGEAKTISFLNMNLSLKSRQLWVRHHLLSSINSQEVNCSETQTNLSLLCFHQNSILRKHFSFTLS